MDAPLDMGVIGVGHLGQHHARIYNELKTTRLVGVVDRDRTRAEEIAARCGCPVFDSVAELATKIRAASVAVPTQHHSAVAVELLRAGVDVLVEKPLARSLDEAETINRTAEEHGCLVMTGHTERFNPAVVALQRAVDAPRFFEIHRLAAFSARSTDIDVVLDLMIHDLDLLLHLDGTPPVSVDAIGVSALTDKVDIANARVRFESGCVANLTASRISAEAVRRIRVFQSRTYLSCDTGARKVERYRLTLTGDGPQIRHDRLPVDDGEPLRAELASFADSVRHRTPPEIDGRHGQRVLALAHEVRRAIEAERSGS